MHGIDTAHVQKNRGFDTLSGSGTLFSVLEDPLEGCDKVCCW